ncbi:MAG: indolepyruvate ferredoxin oxidoreductase subunit alpha [Thermodesulfobacteriota bacterium]
MTVTPLFLSGNEALALGAHEAGVRVASAYPGTPSTEILENLACYPGVYTEWAPNEKVALEVALGAAVAGVRALATMKHVGLNVAADPLFTAAYTGGRAGLVVVVADDPEMHSSQNEQDSRNYALAAKVPMLEPSDPAEAKEFLKTAFAIAEEFDTPVLVRSSTRIAHVKGLVTPAPAPAPPAVSPGLERRPDKYVMLPIHARTRRLELERRMASLKQFAEAFLENRIEWGDRRLGFITSGVSYLYVKEAFPEASVLKLGLVHPLPESLIGAFAAEVERLVVVEELDPILETQIRAMGIRAAGKEIIPARGELAPQIVRVAVTGTPIRPPFEPLALPPRPPNMCPGCPHRGVFYALSRLKLFVSGDIGCYTLGALPPLAAMDSCVCMGASISMAHGMDKALGDEALGKVVAVIGDSTFLHSGITGLLDIVYNKGCSTVIILDNRITAMTGHQANPASGRTLAGDEAPAVDLEALCRAIGVPHVVTVDPHDHRRAMAVIQEEVARPAPSVIIARAPCALLPEVRRQRKPAFRVDVERCQGCRLCLGLGCPAISWQALTPDEATALGLREKQPGHSRISAIRCAGCGQCQVICQFEAIELATAEQS